MQINIANGTLTQIQETLSPASGYALPSSITVTGATSSYNSTTGAITLTSPTSTMSLSASAVVAPSIAFGNLTIDSMSFGNSYVSKVYFGDTLLWEQNVYSISASVTNGTYSGKTQMLDNQTASITITPNSGYALPSSVTVSGATYSYDGSTGIVALSVPTGNVTISATCLQQLAAPTIEIGD